MARSASAVLPLALLGAGAFFLLRGKTSGASPPAPLQPTPGGDFRVEPRSPSPSSAPGLSVEQQVAAAVASASPAEMRRVADELERAGILIAADGLRIAAQVAEAGAQQAAPPPSSSAPRATPAPSLPRIVLPVPSVPTMPSPAQDTPLKVPYVPSARTLRSGSSGIDVQALQLALNRVTGSTLTADGSYGPRTEAEVKHYQQTRGLTPDGIWGPKSAGALQAESML